jgi:hypothetical protein
LKLLPFPLPHSWPGRAVLFSDFKEDSWERLGVPNNFQDAHPQRQAEALATRYLKTFIDGPSVSTHHGNLAWVAPRPWGIDALTRPPKVHLKKLCNPAGWEELQVIPEAFRLSVWFSAYESFFKRIQGNAFGPDFLRGPFSVLSHKENQVSLMISDIRTNIQKPVCVFFEHPYVLALC